MASRSMRPLRTKAAPSVIASRVHCGLGWGVQRFGRRRPCRMGAPLPSRGARQVDQVGALGVVQPRGAGDGVQGSGGDADEGPRSSLE
ncbi:hypothetical protein [Streptomyces sp. NPDC003006]